MRLCAILSAGLAFHIHGAEPGDKTKEPEKERDFKYSAWCAFRDVNSQTAVPRNYDPETSEETQPAAPSWEGFGRHGQWTTIVVELGNTTEKYDFTGALSIRMDAAKSTDSGEALYRTSYQQKFELGPRTRKQYKFSVLCPETGWSNEAIPVEIVANGRAYATRLIALHDLDGFREDFIVVVSENAGSFRYLATKTQNLPDVDSVRRRRVAIVEPRELPTRWHDLTLANLIIIDGPPREKLNPAQWEAILAYVQSGGQVLITAGKDPSRLKGPIEDLAGITVKQMTETSSLTSDDLDSALLLKPDVRLPMVEVDASSKYGMVISRSPQTQLVERCTRSYGPGSVTFLPYSLSDPMLMNWKGRESIPLAIIERARERRLFSTLQADDLTTNTAGPQPQPPQRADLGELRAELDESFSKDTPVQAQPKATVLAFLLFYLLFAVPGNYFIFGWFRRREIAWLAVPVWAASFSVLAYVIGYMGQTGQLTVNEVSVIEAGSNQAAGMARTFLGLYAPRRDNYRLQFPSLRGNDRAALETQAAPNHLINIQQQRRSLDKPELSLVDTSQGMLVDRLLVQQRSTRQLEIQHRAPLGDGLSVTARRDESGALKIEVGNRTGTALHSPVFVYEGTAIELGVPPSNILAAGATRTIVCASGDAAIRKPVDAAFFGKTVVIPPVFGQHVYKRSTALNKFIRAQIENYSRGTVCAWMERPEGSLPVLIAGSSQELHKPKIEGVTLLLMPVRIRTTNTTAAMVDSIRLQRLLSYDLAAAKFSRSEDLTTATLLAPDRSTPKGYENPTMKWRRENTVSAHFLAELPVRFRELADDGRRLHLSFSVDGKTRGPGSAAGKCSPAIDGELTVSLRRTTDTGVGFWVQMPAVMRAAADGPTPVEVTLPLADYRALVNNTMHLRVAFTPNEALHVSGRVFEIRLTHLECRLTVGVGER